MTEGNIKETNKGTPQGGVISPLLANVYLHEMDKAIIKWVNVRLVRYADDFVILCKTGWMAKKTMERLKKLLSELKLQLNETKTQMINAEEEEFEFLGFKFRIRRKSISPPLGAHPPHVMPRIPRATPFGNARVRGRPQSSAAIDDYQ